MEGNAAAVALRCAECGTQLRESDDQETTDHGTFCRHCYGQLVAQVQEAVSQQSENINWPMALIGGIAGGAAGALVWWGFTVMTEIAFGLVAIVIGWAVGKGIVMGSGGKRSASLQLASVAIAVPSFFYATYLVTRSFVNEAPELVAAGLTLPILPTPEVAIDIISAGFEPFDLIFLAIVVWEAWRPPSPSIPRRIRRPSASGSTASSRAGGGWVWSPSWSSPS